MQAGTQGTAGQRALGWAGWILRRLRPGGEGAKRRLVLEERIPLGPHQSLALVEADGKRILVATSQVGAAAFFALDFLPAREKPPRSASAAERVSW